MTIHDILGRWLISAWEQRYDDGRVTYPLGRELTGFIEYGEGYSMSLMIASVNRPKFVTGGQWSADEAEKARAYDGYLCYAGTFAMHDDEIHHHVAISLYPDWVGGTQKRKAAIVDGSLRLIARIEAGTPEARTATLFWRRPDA